MKCGFCSFFCPVYQEEKMETCRRPGQELPRKTGLKGEQEFTPEMGEIIGKCLLCKRCVANCPSKTQIDRVVVAARAQMVKDKGLGFIKNFVFRKVMANKKAIGQVREARPEVPVDDAEDRRQDPPPARFHQSHGQRRNFPEFAKTFSQRQVKPVYKPAGKTQDEGRLLHGLRHRLCLSRTRSQAHRLPRQTQHRSGGPRDQNCCGAAIYFTGDFETGRMLADKNIKAFKDSSTISSPPAAPAVPP